MKSLFQSPKFKKLQSEWYKKLKVAGFEDAETQKGALKEWHSFRFNKNSSNLTIQEMQETATYYTKAEHLLNSFEFKSELHKTIWKLHSEGKSYREISDLLPSLNLKPLQSTQIGVIIQEIRQFIV